MRYDVQLFGLLWIQRVGGGRRDSNSLGTAKVQHAELVPGANDQSSGAPGLRVKHLTLDWRVFCKRQAELGVSFV